MAFLESLLGDPVGQAAVVPFAVGVAFALLLAASGGAVWGRRLAPLAIGAGFFVAVYLILGFPPFPPVSFGHKMIAVAAIGLALGFVLDIAGLARAGGHFFAFVLPAAALYWLWQRDIAAGPATPVIATLAALFLVSIVVYWRQAASARGGDTDEASSAALFPPIQIFVASLGFAGIGIADVPSSSALLGAALAAAAGGYLLVSFLWHLVSGRALGYGAIGAFGAGGAWLALGYAAVFRAETPIKLALLGVVALVFVVDAVARPLALMVAATGSPVAQRLLQPLAYGMVVAIPPAAAIAYAWFVLGWRMG
jgi:hypothetical protein